MELRSRQKQPFSGFTKAEVQKMEQLLNESNKQLPNVDYFKNLAKVFNRSGNRAGKPNLKWTEIQNWFRMRRESHLSEETSLNEGKEKHALNQTKAPETPKTSEGPKGQDLPNLEFEAKSSTDGAWYDVERFLSHRFLGSGEVEVYVRYVGFGSQYDEWVNVKKDVRERSVTLEHSECQKLKVGDPVVCFQVVLATGNSPLEAHFLLEYNFYAGFRLPKNDFSAKKERQDQARYYDARVVDIQRRLHDVRGCKCLFLVTYDHDSSQERVRLRRLCCRPNMLAHLERS